MYFNFNLSTINLPAKIQQHDFFMNILSSMENEDGHA